MALDLYKFIKGIVVKNDTDLTKQLQLEVSSSSTTGTKTTVQSSQTANRTVTLPDATDTLVGKATTDTLTNKTFDADGTGNVLSNIDDGNIKSGAAIDVTKLADGSISNTEFQFLNNVSSNIQDQLNDKLSAVDPITIEDANLTIVDETDATKTMKFELGSLPTATDITLDVPNASGELTLNDATQTLSNKTLDADNNTLSNIALASLKTIGANTNRFITRDGSGDVVDSVSLPAGSVVGTSATQTLTNKTIDADSNTISNIENADIKAGAAIDAAKIADGSVSNTEFQYLGGVTSDVQTQLDAKQARATLTTKGDLYVATASATVARQAVGTDGQVLTADSTLTNGIKWSTPGSTTSVLSKTASYTLVPGDGFIYWDTSGGAATATLPTAVGNTGTMFKITLATAGNPLTINTTSGQTIGGIASGAIKMGTRNDNMEVISDGTNWQLVSFDVQVFVSYAQDTIQSLSNNTDVLVDFETMIEDPLGLVTTGGSWTFTPPYPGVYSIDASVVVTIPNAISYSGVWGNVYKGGTFFRLGDVKNGTTVGANGISAEIHTELRCSGPSDTIQFYAFQSSGAARDTDGAVADNFITIRRIGN